MNSKTAILLAAAFIAVAAVSVRSQQTWQDKARELSGRNPAQAAISKPIHAAVILGLKETSRLVTDGDGSYYETSGWKVRYATVSSNGPAIQEGMNGADAIAAITATGLKLVFSDYGFHVFSGEINQ